MRFDPSIIFENWQLFANGLLTTLLIVLVALPLAFVIAIPIAFMKLSRLWPLRALAIFYIEVFRNAPFLIVLYVIFYALPTLQIRLPALVVGTGVLCLYASSYLAEIIRGAFLAVPKGQLEAARAVGMSRLQGIMQVVAPQMLSGLIPPSTNMGIILIKETSVLALISVTELTYQGMSVQAATFAAFEVFLAVGALYWVLCAALSAIATSAEKRSARSIAGARRASVADSFLSLEPRGRK